MQTGSVVGSRYEVVRPLGKGAFGHTFLARDREHDRDVALKVFDPSGGDEWKARELFEREASVLRGLRHHGIPEVYDLVDEPWNGAPASILVMEYVEGISLHAMIDSRRQLDAADVSHLLLELLGILDYLHNRVPPILHRDIKPANVIVRPDGSVSLVDFGSVRRVYLAPDESGSTVAGTYGYMPYEQYMGQASPASDLFALAATFLHVLTGRPPRDFMNEEGRIQVPETLPGSASLREVLARMLQPSPQQRFRDARDVRRALLESSASVAVQPLGRAGAVARANVTPHALLLEPVPRPSDDRAKALVDELGPHALEMMDTSAKRTDKAGLLDWLTLAFFSVITFGVLPIVFTGMARARRRQLRRFIRDGALTTARVGRIEMEQTAFGEKMARVHYTFDADGATHRDSDLVLPAIARRWESSDEIHVLYIADAEYDSIVVSTR